MVTIFKEHNLSPSMSRLENCDYNAVIESIFSSLKKEKIPRHVFKTRADTKAEIFDYIEVF